MFYIKSRNIWVVKHNGKQIAYNEKTHGKYAKELAHLSQTTKEKYNNYYTFTDQIVIIHIYSKKFGYKDVCIDSSDYEKVKNYKWYIRKQWNTFYCEANNKCGNKIKLHKLLTDTGSDVVIDHINRNGLDNRKDNLRISNVSENGKNSKRYSTNKSGHKGVSISNTNNQVYANWVENGVFKGVSFNIGKYGLNIAISLAVVARYENAYKCNYTFNETEYHEYLKHKKYLEDIV